MMQGKDRPVCLPVHFPSFGFASSIGTLRRFSPIDGTNMRVTEAASLRRFRRRAVTGLSCDYCSSTEGCHTPLHLPCLLSPSPVLSGSETQGSGLNASNGPPASETLFPEVYLPNPHRDRCSRSQATIIDRSMFLGCQPLAVRLRGHQRRNHRYVPPSSFTFCHISGRTPTSVFDQCRVYVVLIATLPAQMPGMNG